MTHSFQPSVRAWTTIHAPAATLPTHSREASYLSLVLRGRYFERIGKAGFECLPLSLRFHPAGEEHAHTIGETGAHCLMFELSDVWQESLRRLTTRACEPVFINSAGASALRANALYSLNSAVPSAQLEHVVAELLQLCEDSLRLQSASRASTAIQRVVAVIEECLDQELTLTALASVACLHPTHFARSFRAATGYTVHGYIRHRRIARAQTLLVNEPNKSLSRIAAETGFADHGHLTRTFRALVGMVPSVYRRDLRDQVICSP